VNFSSSKRQKMDANNFVMSSYQFVNSLASCYPNNANVNSANSTSNGPQNDYFPGSAYTPNLYPGGHPQSHYPNTQAYNPLSAAAGGNSQPGNSDMVDYTQLQPQKFMLNQQQALGQASCKYADGAAVVGSGTPNINQTSISSPQDLSTARDISPKLSPSSVVESAARSLNKQAASQQHNATNNNNNNNNTITNNNSKTNNNTNPTNNSSHLQSTALPMRSPDGDESDASSDSGTEGGSGTGNGKKGPPQIYPWMKRVHIGTSKCNSLLSFIL